MAVLYPFGPEVRQSKGHFVWRNYFVAALADALVVIQGKAKSGTRHTAKFAHQLGKKIFAVPGFPSDPLSWIPNGLLACGKATVLQGASQLIEALVTKDDLGFTRSHKSAVEKVKITKDLEPLPGLLAVIAQKNNAATMDEILAITGGTYQKLQGELLSYEIEGRIKKRGAQFVLTGN